jgi:predicted Rdx family selenoprotein
MSEYQQDIERFELEPGSGGDFELTVDGRLAYSKRETGEYPDIRVLKSAVADAIDARAGA